MWLVWKLILISCIYIKDLDKFVCILVLKNKSIFIIGIGWIRSGVMFGFLFLLENGVKYGIFLFKWFSNS